MKDHGLTQDNSEEDLDDLRTLRDAKRREGDAPTVGLEGAKRQLKI